MRRVLLAAAAAAAGIVLVGWQSATASTSYAGGLLAGMNAARAQHGLPPLANLSTVLRVAQPWADHMAAEQAIAHNPNLSSQLDAAGCAARNAWGENVAYGPADDPNAVVQGYMNSPEHRDNILNPAYRYVGIGVAYSGNVAYDTVDFVDTCSTAAAAVSAPAPAPAVARPAGPTATVRHIVAATQRPAVTPPTATENWSLVAAPDVSRSVPTAVKGLGPIYQNAALSHGRPLNYALLGHGHAGLPRPVTGAAVVALALAALGWAGFVPRPRRALAGVSVHRASTQLSSSSNHELVDADRRRDHEISTFLRLVGVEPHDGLR